MSYLRKIELQREENRLIENRRKAELEKHLAKLRRTKTKPDAKPFEMRKGLSLEDYETVGRSRFTDDERTERKEGKLRLLGYSIARIKEFFLGKKVEAKS